MKITKRNIKESRKGIEKSGKKKGFERSKKIKKNNKNVYWFV